MLHRQLGKNRGESRTANVIDRLVVVPTRRDVSRRKKRRLAQTPLQRFLIRVTCDDYERADRRPAYGKNRQPV
jgi:hypothetical protein